MAALLALWLKRRRASYFADDPFALRRVLGIRDHDVAPMPDAPPVAKAILLDAIAEG
jgi:hypothetical protein